MWLEGWTPGSRLPIQAKVEAVRLLARWRDQLTPASPKALMGAVAAVLTWAKDLGILPPGDEEAGVRFGGYYRRVLEPMPADLMELAARRVMDGHVFHTMPKPGAFTAAVASETARRQSAVARLESVLRFGKFDVQDMAPEDRVDPEKLRELAREIDGKARLAEAQSETEEAGETPHRGPRIWNKESVG